MTDHNRIKLRAPHAAAYHGCSVASLYRKAKTTAGFPQPHKFPGKRLSFWYKDELDAFHEANAEDNKAILDIARHCRDAAFKRVGSRDCGHPLILAFELAGGKSNNLLHRESGLSAQRIRVLSIDHKSISDEELIALFTTVAAQVLHREEELAKKLIDNPALRDDISFRRALRALNDAHELCFGRTLLEYFMEARENGNS